MRRVLGFVLAASLFAVPYAQAGQPRTHDGLFLRLSVGPSLDQTKLGDIKLDGTGADANFALGGMIGKNLVLHGTLWGWDVSSPDYEVGGTLVYSQGSMSMGAVGGGLTYYFMPSNIYLTGSVGGGKLSFEDQNGNSQDTDPGVALDLGLGKEWWVGNSWGLGLAAGLNYHSFPDKAASSNWEGVSYALRFSATLN